MSVAFTPQSDLHGQAEQLFIAGVTSWFAGSTLKRHILVQHAAAAWCVKRSHAEQKMDTGLGLLTGQAALPLPAR
jgi:hypothetical protein